jgi:hypothetical protein
MSFKLAHNLHAHIESLPKVPQWKHQTITVKNAHNIAIKPNRPSFSPGAVG